MKTKYIHDDCEIIVRNRILKTPQNKYVFDTFYNEAIVISDGKEYNNMAEAQTALNEMLENIENHKITNAIIC